MLVQALAAYADEYLKKELSDLAFVEKPVPYAVEIDEKGKYLGVVERTDQVKQGKKTVTRARPMLVPNSPVNRNSGVHPLLGCDAIQYVIGADEAWTGDKEREKHDRHHDGFVSLVKSAAVSTGDSALAACAKFYAEPERVAQARSDMAAKKPNGGANVALVVRYGMDGDDPGGPVVERQAVRDFWRKHYAERFAERNAEGGEAMCLISGEVGPVAVTHDKIKGLSSLGGQASGVALMSFDKDAFRSYGWEQNANSPVSPERAAAYVLALNDLLRHGTHRQGRTRGKVLRTRSDHGGVGFLFWTRLPEDENEVDTIENADPDEVVRLMTAPYTGKEESVDVASENAFYFLAVSGNGGRLAVRDWFCESLAVVKANLRAWFEGLRIADVFLGGAPSKPPRMWELLTSVSPPRTVTRDPVNAERDPVNAERTMQLMRRALHGQPLRVSLLAAALGRLRVAQDSDRFNPARIGLVRMCVNDILKSKGEQTMSESLDENETHPAYVCGRLLAVYDAVQNKAHWDPEDPKKELNVNVVDRYYGLASSYPQLAFPKLETLSHAHLKKLRRTNDRAHFYFKREIDGLYALLKGVFPGQLNLEDQGRFAIGFHHQKALAQARIQEAKDRKAEAAVASDSK